MNIARCIMTDAVEGPGIAYWAEIKDITRDDEGYVTGFDVRDNGVEEPRERNDFIRVDESAVKKAVGEVLNGKVGVHRRIASQFVGGDDGWDYDSEGVDCVIQTIAFGKLVYG